MDNKNICQVIAISTIIGIATLIFQFSPIQSQPNDNSGSVDTTTEKSNTVTVKNFEFDPPILNVPNGTKIIFDFEDAGHTVVTASASMAEPININNGEGDSDAVPQGEKREVTVNGMLGGVIEIECGIHGPSMNSVISITEGNMGNLENHISNMTEIQTDVNDIISKLSPLMLEKNRILLKDFLIDLGEDIKKGGHNDTSYLKWIKKQIDTEGINGPLSNAFVYLAGQLSSEQIFHHSLVHLLSENNYSLPESTDERDAKSIDFLLAISPAIIRSNGSNDIVFSGKDAQMMARLIGFNENQEDEIEGIIYLIILEGHNKGANISKLAMNILSKWEEDRKQTFIENRGESKIELWLRTFAVIEPSVRNAIIDLATNMTLTGNEDKIYVNLIEAGRQLF